MSDNPAISIFYIHSPFHVLGPIENFLSKRSYFFASESHIPAALEKIADLQPQFVFVALDHPDPMAQGLAKIIRQTMMVQVIPYINSTSEEQIQKLDRVKENHKLYPPLSGPGVERAIQSILKELGITSNNAVTHFQYERPSDETIQRFKSNFKNDFLQEALLRNLDPDANYASVTVIEDKKDSLGQVKKISDNNDKIQSLGEIEQVLSEDVKNKLSADFNEKFEECFRDILRTAEEYSAAISDGTTALNLSSSFSYFQCFIIKSTTWCGYIVIASPVKLEASDLELPIASWLKGNFQNFLGLKEEDLFHIQVEKADYAEFIKNKVEYSKQIQSEKNEINISFFAAKPSELLLILNDTQEMLEVPIGIVPTDVDLTLSLYIHLPENKKYILFTAENKPLAKVQKERLVGKGVKKLFTQLIFERQLNQMKAENHIQNSISLDKKESS